jgi:hypothetical protein
MLTCLVKTGNVGRYQGDKLHLAACQNEVPGKSMSQAFNHPLGAIHPSVNFHFQAYMVLRVLTVPSVPEVPGKSPEKLSQGPRTW